MGAKAAPQYAARLGYVGIDARRYEHRRYGGVLGFCRLRMLLRAVGRALADVEPGSLVLDLPCGTGVLADVFSALALRVVRADISPEMLRVARTRPGAVGHVRADVEAAPWLPRSFAAVVSVRFVMLLPPALRPRVLRALANLTVGPLIITVCHPYTAKPVDTRRLTRWVLEREAAAAGLRVERIHWVAPVFSEVWVVVLSPRRSDLAGAIHSLARSRSQQGPAPDPERPPALLVG